MNSKISQFLSELDLGDISFSANKLKFVPTVFELAEPLFNVQRASRPTCWLFVMEIRGGESVATYHTPVTRNLSDIILTTKERPTYLDALLTYSVISAKLELLTHLKWVESYQHLIVGYETIPVMMAIAEKVRHQFSTAIGYSNYQTLMNRIEQELKNDHKSL